MGRPTKEKTNCKESINALIKKEGIDGHIGLLIKMYSLYYKGKVYETDKYQWAQKQEAEFSKKINGIKSFSESDIKAIERVFDMSWVDIVEPLSEKKAKEKKEFKPCGLRYAAYTDDERCFAELDDRYDEDDRAILCNYDEFGKTILDYIFEYKVENKSGTGFKYLINNGYIRRNYDYYRNMRLQGRIYDAEKYSEKIWDWIIEIDDSELFLKFFGDLFSEIDSRDEKIKNFVLELIIKSRNIFACLCTARERSDNKAKFMPSLLFELLKFALEKNENTVAQNIFAAYTKFIDERTEELQNDGDDEKKFVYTENYGEQIGVSRGGEPPKMYVWDFFEVKNDTFKEQIEYCNPEKIIERLEVKNLSSMKLGSSFVKGGTYYIKMKWDVSLEALKYLTEEKKCEYLPAYLGEEEGVFKISAWKNFWNYHPQADALAKMLGEIHSLSFEKLGEGQVYMYSKTFSRESFGYAIVGPRLLITNWRKCEIGSPIEDITTAILKCFAVENDSTHKDISEFLEGYPHKGIIEKFGDRFNSEIDKMIVNAVREQDAKNIKMLYMTKAMAEIYRGEFNRITELKSEDSTENAQMNAGEV